MSNSNNPSRILADYVYGLNYNKMPASTIEHTKFKIIDFFASAMAGRKINGPMNKIFVSYIQKMGGTPESRILFGYGKLPAPNAAFLNAFLGHGCDLDDSHITAMGHPGVHIVPTVFAAADLCKAKPTEIILAIVAGYELFIRISNGVMPSMGARGFHSTGIVGSVASAGAAAKLLGLDSDGIHRAMSLGALSSSGLFEIVVTAQAVKPFNAANAARSGIVCAQLAQAGAEAPEEPLSGSKGFFKAFADDVRLNEIISELGKEMFIETAHTKLYPACRHVHGAIECGMAHYESGVTPENIEKIRLYVYPGAISVAGKIMEPCNEGEAKFSISYGAAVAMVRGTFVLNDLQTAATMSDTIRNIIRKMEIVPTPELENREKRTQGTRIELFYKDGSVSTKEIVVPRGEVQTPITREDMRHKLSYCAEDIYSTSEQQKLFDLIFSFEKLADYDEVFNLLCSKK